MIKDRNYGVDALKLLCALLIVFIHCPWTYKDYILPITRCAVPIFFMISGYFLYSKDDFTDRLKKSIPKIFKYLVYSTILFAVYKELMAVHHHNLYIPSLRDVLYFVIFNENPFGVHLWYLSAYLYVLMIVLLSRKWHFFKLLLFSIPLLLILDLVFGKYSMVLWHREYNYIYVRNFLCVGLPYFLIGALIKTSKSNMLKISLLTCVGG